MKRIPEQDHLIPPSLEKARIANAIWDDFTKTEQGCELRELKFTAQGGRCAYCECSLRNSDGWLSKGVSHIDHFYPRNRGVESNPGLTFDWNNLLLSCMSDESCGLYKDRQTIPPSSIINPLHADPRDYITFNLVRKLLCACKLPNIEQQKGVLADNTIQALNLNAIRLQRMRYNEWLSFEPTVKDLMSYLENIGDNDELLGMLQDEIRNLIDEMEKSPFCSSLISLLRSTLSPLYLI